MLKIKIGIPKGLLYSKYYVFAHTFISNLGAEIIVSPDTNKEILDSGVKLCTDEACLPIKIYFGHVDYLKDKCDALLMPRFIGIEKDEYICPMFCGVNDMVKYNIKNLPLLIDTPVYSKDYDKIKTWALKTGKFINGDKKSIISALNKALQQQNNFNSVLNQDNYSLKIALIGHTYNINDHFLNMAVIKKLNAFGIGVITEEYVKTTDVNTQTQKLYKKPFWTFAKHYYGAALSMYKNRVVDGIVYLSCFSCGIDSVIIELIENELDDFPFMVLKLDEHTGQAGINTRIEAFYDMLKRRKKVGNNVPSFR